MKLGDIIKAKWAANHRISRIRHLSDADGGHNFTISYTEDREFGKDENVYSAEVTLWLGLGIVLVAGETEVL